MSAAHLDGAALIAAERQRQVSVEGWTPSHDDGHGKFEMARAARCYVESAIYQGRPLMRPEIPVLWPWEPECWKPSGDSVRDLVRAGALIAAEIDRLQRLRAKVVADHA